MDQELPQSFTCCFSRSDHPLPHHDLPCNFPVHVSLCEKRENHVYTDHRSPVQSYWGVRSVGACRPESRELFATSAASCVCDFMLLCLPLPIIWQLQMSVRKRVQAIALLSVGLIACASSGVRTYYVWHLFHSSQDTSWNAYPIYFTSDLEIILGIVSAGFTHIFLWLTFIRKICACTPHIKPLAKRWFGKKNATMVQERHEAAEQRIKEPKSAASPDVESLDFITEATPHQ